MSIQLITNQPENKRPKNVNGNAITLCDPESTDFAETNLRMVKPVDLATIRSFYSNFFTLVQNLPSVVDEFKQRVLLSANFPIEDIKAMIDQNGENIKFVRLYMGIDEYNNQVLTMAPVDKNRNLIETDGTFYSQQCCGYPPHIRNFAGDPIINP